MIEGEAMDGGGGAREGEDDPSILLFRPNPFVQPPVLKVLFELLPMEELAKCRLVSKLWYKESSLTWRSIPTVEFGKEGIVSTRGNGEIRTTSIGEFLNLWEAGEWGSCPFKKFNLESWNFEAGNWEQKRFLELVGGHVTSLTLVYCSFVGRENFRRIIFQTFPKLQFLKLEGCRVDNAFWYEPEEGVLEYKQPDYGLHGLKSLNISNCRPHSLMDMLSHFHKLNSLHLESGAREPVFRNLLETIRLIRAQDQTKLPLTNFDVEFEFELRQSRASSIELLKLQNQLNLPLQRLHYFDPDEEGNDNFENVIRDILQHHSSTLKYLAFIGNNPRGLCKFFPFGFCLENLEELAIGCYRFSDNLNYLRSTPKLRILKIQNSFLSQSLFSNSLQLEIGDWTLPTLTELTLFSSPLSLCNLKKLMKWMPNLERLSGVELDDVRFSMICRNLKNLKDIRDWGTELTDEGVIGRGNVQEAGDEEIQCAPNITQLKNLTSFRTRSSKLTSTSVRDGFLKLANLKLLWFGRFTQLDDSAKAALKRRNIEHGI